MSFARDHYGSRIDERKNGARLAIWRGLIFLAAFSAIPRPGLVSGRLGWAQNAEIFWESLFKKKLLLQNFYFYEQNNKKKIYNCKINLNFDNIVDIIKTLKKPTYEQKNWERALRVKHNFALIKIFKFELLNFLPVAFF